MILGDKMAKRFRFNGDTHILDTETNKEFYAPSENELLDCLNALSDENEQLKYNLSAYMVDLNNCKGRCSALEIVNEQLKQQVNDLSKENIHLDARVMDLQERLMNR